MHPATRPPLAPRAGLLLLLLVLQVSSSLAVSDRVRVCTPEEEAAYDPFRPDWRTVGCDVSTFKTCSDNCLQMYELAAAHAPNCQSLPAGRVTLVYLESDRANLERCERARANATNKYFPQVVPGVPECDASVTSDGITMDDEYHDCATYVSTTCSDACLRIIEDRITSAPLCRMYGKGYSLGETKKQYLVACLNTRNESLARNNVLNTLAVPDGTPSSMSMMSTRVSAAVTSLLVLVLAVL